MFSSLQNSSNYPGRSQQGCSLDVLYSSSYFQVLQSQYQSFCDCAKRINYQRYHRRFHGLLFFSSLGKSRYLSLFLLSVSFIKGSPGTVKFTIQHVLFFLLNLTRSGPLAKICLYVKIPEMLVRLIPQYRFWLRICHLFV